MGLVGLLNGVERWGNHWWGRSTSRVGGHGDDGADLVGCRESPGVVGTANNSTGSVGPLGVGSIRPVGAPGGGAGPP